MWLASNSEVEDIGTRIMPGNIQHPSWSAHLKRIDLRVEHCFLLSHRSCNEFTCSSCAALMGSVGPALRQTARSLAGNTIAQHEVSLPGIHFGASGKLVSLIYRMSVVLGGLCSGRVALLAKLIEDSFVFTEVEDTPMGNGHDNGKVQDGAEHQHERDG